MTPTILPFEGKSPDIHESCFIAPTAAIIGDTVIGEGSSIWYGCTVRGDVNYIRIGKGSNLQDNSVIHVDHGKWPTIIGDDVLIGHMCIIHGTVLGDGSFVGMRACLMDGVTVEPGAMVAAGALVTPGKTVPTGQLWGGAPAKYMRDLSQEELDWMKDGARRYAGYARQHKEMLAGQAAG